KALNLARYTKNKINKIKGIKVVSHELLQKEGVHFVDETKLCINVKELNLTGFEVYDLLYQEFNVQVELGDMYNILALISIGTTKSDVDKLIKSLNIISKLNFKNEKLENFTLKQITPKVELSPRDAFYAPKESIDLFSCVGRVSGEFVMAYPPGIPIVSPGEMITYEVIEYIKVLKEKGAYLTDMSDKELNTMLVVK
ncbi:MAG: arginine decarboxylase, partial [Peptostreptococcaceae bacterium]